LHVQVVRPFFNAHGIAQGFPHQRHDEPSNGLHSSDAAEPSGSDPKPSADERKIEVPLAKWTTEPVAPATSAYVAFLTERDPFESHCSSDTSCASSEKKKLIQRPQHAAPKEGRNEKDEHEEDNSVEKDIAVEAAVPQEATDWQVSTSDSSSEERSSEDAAQVAQHRYAVVSEYSSSARAGSSGASNTNLTSTSGSGSAGNTGSGTGGGSSGSGNDQGGSSSNGQGSGNDVKGSGEETMDNSGGNNSGGNSDENRSNNNKKKTPVAVATDVPHVGAHQHGSNAPENVLRDPMLQPQPPQVPGDDEQYHAVRVKKLQDKKRKRMNMRREYEEKVHQEMESPESSLGDGEVFLRPGKPVTLDKVLSFTKTARYVRVYKLWSENHALLMLICDCVCFTELSLRQARLSLSSIPTQHTVVCRESILTLPWESPSLFFFQCPTKTCCPKLAI
jgi:hypothetical protein